jgi:hypothetical protein
VWTLTSWGCFLLRCGYNCLVTTPDGKAMYAVGSDKKLKEFEDQQGAVAISKEFDTAVPLTQVPLPPLPLPPPVQ